MEGTRINNGKVGANALVDAFGGGGVNIRLMELASSGGLATQLPSVHQQVKDDSTICQQVEELTMPMVSKSRDRTRRYRTPWCPARHYPPWRWRYQPRERS